MIIYSIYKIVNNLDGKVYIGFTSAQNPNKRWTEHIRQSKTPKYKNILLYKSMLKYKTENFSFSVIYQSTDKDHTLNVMEKHFISENRSYIGFDDCNGYNMTLGGEGTFGCHKPAWNKGLTNIYSEKTLKLMSDAAKGCNRRINTKHKLESIEKMRLAAYNRDSSYLCKVVSTPCGIFNSLTEAAKHHNKSRSWMTKKMKTHPNEFYIIKQEVWMFSLVD